MDRPFAGVRHNPDVAGIPFAVFVASGHLAAVIGPDEKHGTRRNAAENLLALFRRAHPVHLPIPGIRSAQILLQSAISHAPLDKRLTVHG